MIELTKQQGQAIGDAAAPVLVVDPATKRVFTGSSSLFRL